MVWWEILTLGLSIGVLVGPIVVVLLAEAEYQGWWLKRQR